METLEDVMAHYGVPGMKWGVRKRRSGGSGPSEITITSKPGKGVTGVSGGHGRSATQEAKDKIAVKQKAKKSTLDSLTNDELKAVVKRMQLEEQYRKYNPKKENFAVKYAKSVLKDVGTREMQKLMKGDLSTVDEIQRRLAQKGAGKHRIK